jgi:UDP-N-acetylglucosamine 2-epimerase (non-hydrolysing)/GDP/UDP-N,N'-diacetylbacillosamine 2-epimerase (hydrolysing)
MNKRVIGVFTGSRAEYGLQYPTMRAIEAHPELDYRLIVSGLRQDKNFVHTLSEIREDGFSVHAEAMIDMPGDSRSDTARAIGSGVLSVSQALAQVAPDIFLVYGDRFEAFAAIIASTQANIPTAHIEGGDLTEGGALDDSVRHAMTKLAHLHFTTNQQASNRVLGMGEEPWRVHTVGFPAIDLIQHNIFTPAGDIAARYGLDLSRPLLLFTQHSVTTEFDAVADQIAPSLAVLRQLADEGVQIIITHPNNDAGGQRIIVELKNFTRVPHPNIQVHRALGRANYHGVLALARDPAMRIACVGNSSSGIKESPAFGCPTVNIGSRQDGRLRGRNVIDAPYEAAALGVAIRKCLYDNDFRAFCREVENPYGIGDAGAKIAQVLAQISLDQRLIRKRMTLAGETKDGWFR